ncbi:MAG: DsbA family protein [Patescibacteria group bacterium]
MPEEVMPNKRRSIIVSIITVFVLCLLGLFVWRVLFFIDKINSGEIMQIDSRFTENQTVNPKLISLPQISGIYDVTTDDDPSLGSNEPKVVIVEFGDFGCPYCRTSSFVMRSFSNTYANSVKFIYRDFPVVELHPQAQLAAEASECAHDQGKYWQYHDKLYLNQTNLEKDRLIQIAIEVNMNIEQFKLCLNSGMKTKEVQEDYADGIAAGVQGTPTFFINGVRIAGSIPEDVLIQIIEKVLMAPVDISE